MRKHKDECKFCESRICYERVLSEDRTTYDEIACVDHMIELYRHSDGFGVKKYFISSDNKQSRGDIFKP